MDHSGNTVQVIDTTYLLGGVSLKIYVIDEVDRFVAVARMNMTTADLQNAMDGINRVKAKHRDEDQLPLPPWQ